MSTVSDEDILVSAVSSRLSIGPTDVTKCEINSFVSPKKNHKGLYSVTLRDSEISSVTLAMQNLSSSSSHHHENHTPEQRHMDVVVDTAMSSMSMGIGNQQSTCASSTSGVPGFPDFPSCWMGETGQERREQQQKFNGSSNRKHPIKHRASIKRRIIVRKAVNPPYGPAGTIVKNRKLKSIMRKNRYIKKVEARQKIEQKRTRKYDMSKINKSLAALKCS